MLAHIGRQPAPLGLMLSAITASRTVAN